MPKGRESDPAIERWAGAGHSDDSDPARAGREAVGAAIIGEDPRLVVVFASPRYSFEAVARAAHEAAKPAELIGCAGAGARRGVGAFALGGRGFSAATASAALGRTDSRTAGEDAARSLADVDEKLRHRALIVLADGRAGDPQDVVRGAYSVAGPAVALVGGFAGAQLHGNRIHRNSVVAAALGSSAPLGVGVRHGWRPLGEPLLVTASEGNWLQTLNDRPALDVYLELLAAPEGVEFSRLALRHPFGVAAARGREAQIRAVVGANFQSRTLRCNTEAAVGTLVWPMEGAADEVLDATTLACEQSLAPLRGQPPLGLLAFDSVARAGLGGARARIAAAAAAAPVGSVGTYGEIARTSGSVGFHSHALAVLAIG